ncbi:MAG: hypothetical protein ACD_45C00161G0001 [uncultured bacterium]|nr:MAG: hypothetical protein ACD_45C00161G0001 [uncultured bacterium]OGT34646.1 MAG: hypothetical protein A3C44_01965 [Gammaproteobacteria bacterium RIFCSPHIGHO2_02_FULL_39_13]
MPRVECYLPAVIKEKINRLADQKSISTSKYIAQVLEAHCNGAVDHSNAIFQKKVLAALCDIYACVFDPAAKDANHSAVLMRMQELKRQSEEAMFAE